MAYMNLTVFTETKLLVPMVMISVFSLRLPGNSNERKLSLNLTKIHQFQDKNRSISKGKSSLWSWQFGSLYRVFIFSCMSHLSPSIWEEQETANNDWDFGKQWCSNKISLCNRPFKFQASWNLERTRWALLPPFLSSYHQHERIHECTPLFLWNNCI